MGPADSFSGQLGGGQQEMDHDVLGTLKCVLCLSVKTLKKEMIKPLVSGYILFYYFFEYFIF